MGSGGNTEVVVADKCLSASLSTPHLEALLGGDPVQPGLDGGVPTEAGQTFKRRQEDLLSDVMRDVPIGNWLQQ